MIKVGLLAKLEGVKAHVADGAIPKRSDLGHWCREAVHRGCQERGQPAGAIDHRAESMAPWPVDNHVGCIVRPRVVGIVAAAVALAGSMMVFATRSGAASSTLLPGATTGTESSAALSPGCQLRTAPPGTQAALCQTFDGPAFPATSGRSPALPPLWGVSRMFGNSNSGQGYYNAAIPTPLNACGTTINVVEPNDVAVCNGMLVDAVTDGVGVDNGTVTDLAMYPKQPFDFAGRTGTISFDVSDDSHGNHRAWPELWVADGPEPAPFAHFSSLQTVPKDGFGIRFAGCGQSGAVTGVDSAVVINNYVSNDSFAGDFPNGPIQVATNGCVTQSSGVGNMNHIEVRVSTNEIDVYATNAGDPGGTLHRISTITGINLTLTRGIVWLEDAHYNGNKDGIDQGTHTFSWDNLAFDGPVLPRDLAFDAPDNNTPAPNGWPNMGYPMPANVTVPNVVIPPASDHRRPALQLRRRQPGAHLLFGQWRTRPHLRWGLPAVLRRQQYHAVRAAHRQGAHRRR